MKFINKKGQIGLLATVPIIIGVVVLVLFLFGGVASISWITKLFSGLKSIPTWLWLVLIGIVLLSLISKNKKR